MLQSQKSGSSTKGLRGMGRGATPVEGMRRLKNAASAYTKTKLAMAALATQSASKVSPASWLKAEAIHGPTSWPPSKTPKMMEAIVRPSIQPLALTSCEGSSSSVRMPYLAGE